MRYNRYLYWLSELSVPITNIVKVSISVADISDCGTPLISILLVVHALQNYLDNDNYLDK